MEKKQAAFDGEKAGCINEQPRSTVIDLVIRGVF